MKLNWGLTILLLFLSFLPMGTKAQSDANGFYLSGSLKVDQGIVDGAKIDLNNDKVLIHSITANRTGNFRYKLMLGKTYEITFSKTGYYSKNIIFDTHVPEDVCAEDCNFPPYQLFVSLLKKVPGVDESSLQAVVGRISYDRNSDNFKLEGTTDTSEYGNKLREIVQKSRERAQKVEGSMAQQKQQKYAESIASADDYYKREMYSEAMQTYRDAVMLKPAQKYPRVQVDECYKELVLRELERVYGRITSSNKALYLTYADQKKASREYTMSYVAYKQIATIDKDAAIQQNIDESLQQIDQLRNLALDEVAHKETAYKSREQRYKELTAQADEEFYAQHFTAAKKMYAEAAMLIDEREHALGMIHKIDEMLGSDEAAQKLAKEREDQEKARIKEARDRAYKDAISEADMNLNQRKYRDALEYYELALSIKEYEVYPRRQIIIVKNILADLESKGIEYNNLIRRADELLAQKQYVDSKKVYGLAHDLVKDETYALQKIDEIDRLMVALEQQMADEEKYKKLIMKADDLLGRKNYNESLSTYQDALALKTNDPYAQQQIKKIRTILENQQASKQPSTSENPKFSEYRREIELADKAFNAKNYEEALTRYQKALTILPGQEYPTSQMRKIKSIMEQPKGGSALDRIDFAHLENVSGQDREAAYIEAMRLGNSFIKSKDLSVARFYFKRALALKPNDDEATKKLEEVERLIRGNDGAEIRYAEMIQKADEAFRTGDLSIAKFYYSKSKDIKPNDPYSVERLATIVVLEKTAVERESSRDYDIAMEKANTAFAGKDYSIARFYYKKAQAIKPNDQVVAKRLKEIEALLKK